MTMIKKISLLASASAVTLLSGCMDADGTYNQTANGALIGAATGAATGILVSDDNKQGAIIGGALGGIAGAGIGYNLEQQEAELRQQLAGSGAVITNTGDQLIVSLPEAITFAVDSATVKPSLYPSLQDVANSLQQYPGSVVQVIGHTDSTGDAAYNQGLSERRAQSVGAILVGDGVAAARVRTVGMGERQPIASNDTDAGRAQNRRVDITIIPVQ